MDDTNRVNLMLERLRNQPVYGERFVSLLIEDILTRPVRELFEPARIAPSLAASLRKTVESPDFVAWLQARIDTGIGQIKTTTEPLRKRLPPDLPQVLKNIMRRPFTPRRELVRALIDQPTMRNQLQRLLQTTLSDFATKFWSSLPDTSQLPGARLRSKLLDVAKGVASMVSSGIERQFDDRVSSFVSEALGRTVDMVVDRICDPRSSSEMATWREDLIDALFNLPQTYYLDESRKFSPAHIAADIHAILLSFAHWDQLEAVIASELEAVGHELFNQTLREYLATSGLEQAWRSYAEEQLLAYTRLLLAGDAFAAWLEELGSPATEPSSPPSSSTPEATS